MVLENHKSHEYDIDAARSGSNQIIITNYQNTSGVGRDKPHEDILI